jgi:RNA polymerase sigma-70 factor (ECF subfamily)
MRGTDGSPAERTSLPNPPLPSRMAATPDDLEIARRARAGDGAALDALSERLACVPRFVHHLMRERGLRWPSADVDDVVQDVVMALWRRLVEFRGDASLETWAYRFCDLHLRNHARRRRNKVRVTSLPEVAAVLARTEETAADRLDAATVLDLLDRLEPQEAAVLRLRYLGDLTLAATALQLGVPEGTVKTRFYRSLVKLRALLETPKDRR